MRVIATRMGFRQGHRVRVGSEFDLTKKEVDALKTDKDGDKILPSWVVEATPDQKKKLADRDKYERERNREAALAAAGPKRAKHGYAAAPGAEDLV